MHYDHALSTHKNHEAAAFAWLAKHGESPAGEMLCSESPTGNGCIFMQPDGDFINAMGNLLQWAVGNRGSKTGNAYCVPEVKDALRALHYAVTGDYVAELGDTYATADTFKKES